MPKQMWDRLIKDIGVHFGEKVSHKTQPILYNAISESISTYIFESKHLASLFNEVPHDKDDSIDFFENTIKYLK